LGETPVFTGVYRLLFWIKRLKIDEMFYDKFPAFFVLKLYILGVA